MDALAREEREKYLEVYGSGAYMARDSVGARVVPIAWGWARGLGVAASATDWGCGHGRAMRWLRDRGLRAHGLDLVACRETKDDPRFQEGTIWAPPGSLPTTEFAFCADVLEHVPQERVDAALYHMAVRTSVGGWFQVATIPDQRGEMVGRTLHLTVQPAGWWVERAGLYFDVVATEVTDREVRLWLRT